MARKKAVVAAVETRVRESGPGAPDSGGVGSVGAKVLGRAERRRLQPGGARQKMRERLAQEFDEIVDGFVKEAKKGGCQHVKLAAELLKPTRKGASRKKGAAERFLEKWEEKQRVEGRE